MRVLCIFNRFVQVGVVHVLNMVMMVMVVCVWVWGGGGGVLQEVDEERGNPPLID